MSLDYLGSLERDSERVNAETLVHRIDIERAADVDMSHSDPALAADGIDQYLDIVAGWTRRMHSAPGSGETARLRCTDAAGEWVITFLESGDR